MSHINMLYLSEIVVQKRGRTNCASFFYCFGFDRQPFVSCRSKSEYLTGTKTGVKSKPMRISFLLLRLIKRFRHFNHLFFWGGGGGGDYSWLKSNLRGDCCRYMQYFNHTGKILQTISDIYCHSLVAAQQAVGRKLCII